MGIIKVAWLLVQISCTEVVGGYKNNFSTLNSGLNNNKYKPVISFNGYNPNNDNIVSNAKIASSNGSGCINSVSNKSGYNCLNSFNRLNGFKGIDEKNREKNLGQVSSNVMTPEYENNNIKPKIEDKNIKPNYGYYKELKPISPRDYDIVRPHSSFNKVVKPPIKPKNFNTVKPPPLQNNFSIEKSSTLPRNFNTVKPPPLPTNSNTVIPPPLPNILRIEKSSTLPRNFNTVNPPPSLKSLPRSGSYNNGSDVAVNTKQQKPTSYLNSPSVKSGNTNAKKDKPMMSWHRRSFSLSQNEKPNSNSNEVKSQSINNGGTRYNYTKVACVDKRTIN